METRIFTDAAQLPRSEWNALASTAYQTRAWFLANQRHWSGTGFTYFAAYRGGSLRALLPVYDRPGALYVGPAGLLFGARSGVGGSLKYAIVGSPTSFDSGVIGDRRLVDALASRAATHFAAAGVDILAFPFCREPVRRSGVVSRRSLVDFDLELPGSSFDDYLGMLSRRRRGEIRREMRAAQLLRFEDVPLAGHEHVVAEYRRLSAGRHGRFADLDTSFYKHLADELGDRCRVLLAIAPDASRVADRDPSAEGGRVVGASSYLEHDGGFFLFHGGARRERFTYFNLTFYELIRQAYRRGARFINFRPAGDEAKLNRGCAAVRTVACFEPISRRGRAALVVLVPALEAQRRIRRRLRRVAAALPRRAGAGARPASGSTGAPGSRS